MKLPVPIVLALLGTFLLLSGCNPRPNINAPDIPVNLTQECPKLPELIGIGDNVTMGDLVLYNIEIIGLYNECKSNHKGLIQVIRAGK